MINLTSKFWSKIEVNGPIPEDCPELGPCWIWTGGRTRNGYGRWCTRRDGIAINVNVHRAVFEVFKGAIPEGLEPDHLCRVRECCNPDHLEEVTRLENFRRGSRAGALGRMHAAKTHCPRGHPYDEKNTYRIKTGGRSCRACKREKWREKHGFGKALQG